MDVIILSDSESEIEDIVSNSLKEAYSNCSIANNVGKESDTTDVPCVETSIAHENEIKIENGIVEKLQSEVLEKDLEKENPIQDEIFFTIDRSCKNSRPSNGDTQTDTHGTDNTKRKIFTVTKKCVRLDCGIDKDDLYINVNPELQADRKMKRMEELQMTTSDSADIMEKCVMKSGFERLHEIPPYEESLNQLKKKRRMERDKTKGENWYNLPAVEMTEERKNDLKILQMRKAVNPNRFYKANDLAVLPKYCQFGRVVETSADFYSSRIPRRRRKQTMADELLADAAFTSYNKQKYKEVLEAKRKGTGPYETRREREKKRERKRRLKKAAKVF